MDEILLLVFISRLRFQIQSFSGGGDRLLVFTI